MDDDSDDLLFLEEALRSVDTSYQILHAFDGIEGLERLAQMKVEANLPCKIVLDINMPRSGGRETFLQSKPTPLSPFRLLFSVPPLTQKRRPVLQVRMLPML